VQQSFPVSKKAQTIEFTSGAPGPRSVGGPTYTVTAKASSGLPVTLTIDATSAAVCSLSGSTVSFIGEGTCRSDANQPGNGEYNAAPQEQLSFAVGPDVRPAQTISFTSTVPAGATIGASYEVAAEATSKLAVTFTIDASSAAICTITGSTVTFTAAGTCTIDANQPGSTAYKAAPQAQQSATVAQRPQTIVFGTAAPVSATVGGPAYSVSASASSGLPVALSVDAASGGVCSISGTSVSFIGAGTCTIDANQGGNAEYAPAAQAQQSFGVLSPPLQGKLPGGPMLSTPVPDSSFTAGASSFDPKTGRVTFIETIRNAGTFSWLLTFQNGKFGVFAAGARCKAGLVRLAGRCRPSKVIFATGTAAVPAGVVIFKLRPSPSGLKALKTALKRKKGVLVTAAFTFQSSLGGSPVSHTQTITVKLKKK
jgi:hypothetical protein